MVGEGGSKERWRARVASAAAAFLLEYPGNGDVRGACQRKRKFALRRERERERVSPLLAKTIRGGLMKRGAR